MIICDNCGDTYTEDDDGINLICEDCANESQKENFIAGYVHAYKELKMEEPSIYSQTQAFEDYKKEN